MSKITRRRGLILIVLSVARYEFRPNEFISTLRTVSLATKSTATGRKDYIAVGTTVYRAEDLAARGGVRTLVPSPNAALTSL